MENLMYFVRYVDGEEGKMAQMETLETRVPVNIHLEEGSDFDLEEDTLCSVDLSADRTDLSFYDDEEAFNNAKTGMAPQSMIPCGTFSLHDDPDFQPSPFIFFAGKIPIMQYREKVRNPDEPNFRFFVESFELNFWLYCNLPSDLKTTDEEGDEVSKDKDNSVSLQNGMIAEGTAWLYGTVKSTEIEPDDTEQ